jgi:hypothetical protein
VGEEVAGGEVGVGGGGREELLDGGESFARVEGFEEVAGDVELGEGDDLVFVAAAGGDCNAEGAEWGRGGCGG